MLWPRRCVELGQGGRGGSTVGPERTAIPAMRVRPAGEGAARFKAAAAQPTIEAGRHALALHVADRHLCRSRQGHQQEQKNRAHRAMLHVPG